VLCLEKQTNYVQNTKAYIITLPFNDKRFNTVISTMDSDYLGGFVKIRILQEIPYGTKNQKPISEDTRIQR